MKYAIWLDGVVLDVDLTEPLYKKFKGDKDVNLPYTFNVHKDWEDFYSKIKGKDIVFLSPYDERTTREIIEKVFKNDVIKFIPSMSKPEKKCLGRLFSEFPEFQPLETAIIGSSPLDLLSARFYDSRIKVLCVNRYTSCAKYSPYLMANSLEELYDLMVKLKL
jgi:hypothetical protein